jgi:hypothetical protein
MHPSSPPLLYEKHGTSIAPSLSTAASTASPVSYPEDDAFLLLLALMSDPFWFHQNGIIWAPNAPLLTLLRPILVIAACPHILYAGNTHNNHKIASLRRTSCNHVRFKSHCLLHLPRDASNHAATGGGRRNTKNAQCAICKGTTRGFVPVFVDLGNDHDGGYYGGGGGASASRNDGRGDSDGDGLIQIDGDYKDEYENEVLEKLFDESDGLWKELEVLFGNENADEEIVDITDRSDGDVALICVAIDLTQHPSFDRAGESSAPSNVTQIQKRVEERTRIQHILKRLKCIQDEILGSLQRPRQRHSHSPLATERQFEQLKSKVLRLQSINADLNSHAKSLQTLNEKLSSTLDEIKRTASDATVEAERTVLRYETLNKKYELMDESYRRHVDRSNLDKNLLQNEITKLQAKYARLSDRSNLQDMREMEEIRAKYRKMSQEVHDLKSKNARLLKESKRKEREWEVRYQKETELAMGWCSR